MQFLMASSSIADVAAVVDVASLEPMLGKIPYHFQVFNFYLDFELSRCLDACILHLRTLGCGSVKGTTLELLEDIPSPGCL